MKLIAAGGNGGGSAEGGGGVGQQQILIRVPTSQHLGIPTYFVSSTSLSNFVDHMVIYHLQLQKNVLIEKLPLNGNSNKK